jgi:hypothetical protein
MLSVGGLVNSFLESLKIRFNKGKYIDLRLLLHWLVSFC